MREHTIGKIITWKYAHVKVLHYVLFENIYVSPRRRATQFVIEDYLCVSSIFCEQSES